MEGGDTWAFDDQTAAHEKFMINGLEDGSGDLSRIIGFEGNMLQGYSFNYDGINSYIDRIEPLDGAKIILENETPNYATAISFANETYKTIGSTACFGGLTDEDGSTKDGLMAEYLYFFDVNYIWTDINKNNFNESNVKAYPNPFNNFVNISVDLTEAQNTEIVIYNLIGEKVTTLVNEKLQSGNHIFTWDAKSSPSGIYFYSIKSGDRTYTKKLILNK